MEQTIGKRIAENRKRLGLTQDALAEKLGVTAQAVSKWENDQSCPDIATLPVLADIFGITTDALLGRAAEQVAQEAEIVDEDESDPKDFHIHFNNNDKTNWEFKWDSGKRDALTFAILVLLVGGLTLADAIVGWEANFWDILWPSALLVFGIAGIFKKFSFFRLGCSLFGGYFLLHNLGIWTLNIGGELVLPIIIVLFGLSLLVDALRKPNKPRFKIRKNGDNISSENGVTESRCSIEEDSFDSTLTFGEDTHYIELPQLKSGDISCSFGELTVDLTGCETLAEDCALDINCSFGQLTLLVPKRFQVVSDSSTAFAELNIQGHPDPIPQGILRLDASISFGEAHIRYV